MTVALAAVILFSGCTIHRILTGANFRSTDDGCLVLQGEESLFCLAESLGGPFKSLFCHCPCSKYCQGGIVLSRYN